MSLAESISQPDHQAPEGEPDAAACLHCGSPMAQDQEWCVECGAARTLIHRPPDWRIPVVVIATIVVVAVAALAIALGNASGSADHSAGTPAAAARAPSTSARGTRLAAQTTRSSTGAASTPTTAATTTTANPPGIASWPVALSAWTVVLARYSDQATANATALRVKGEGLPSGVLNTSDHASLKPGGWVVFTGRYPSRALAVAAAAQLRARGHTARARWVAPTAQSATAASP